MRNNRDVLLGSKAGEGRFSDMLDDNYFAPTWMVYTVPDAKAIGGYDSNEPWKLATVPGEVLVMWWEDGVAAIYWDGAAFKWAGAQR